MIECLSALGGLESSKLSKIWNWAGSWIPGNFSLFVLGLHAGKRQNLFQK
jgi:hypothetical protein